MSVEVIFLVLLPQFLSFLFDCLFLKYCESNNFTGVECLIGVLLQARLEILIL